MRECESCGTVDVLTKVEVYDDDFRSWPQWWCSGCVLDLAEQPAE